MKLEELRKVIIVESYMKRWTEDGASWIFNDNGTVDVKGNVCTAMNDKFDKLPFKFRKVHGYFNCGYNDLKTLENCPDVVYGDFYCYNNLLTSLEFAPNIVTGSFSCQRNSICFSCQDVKKVCKSYGRIET